MRTVTSFPAGAVRVAVMGLRGVPATWGGVEHQCEQLYSRLVSMGFDVTVYARKGYVDPSVKSHKNVRVVCLPTLPGKHLEAIAHTFLAVLHAGFSRFDIWHIYSQGPFLCSPLAKLMRPARPLFFTCGGLDWQRKKWSSFASYAIALGEKLTALLASRVIVVSEALGAYYRKRYGVEALCIVNGVEIPARTLSKAPLGLEAKSYFLFVGRLVPEKRFEDLIEAVLMLKQDVRLVVAGGSAAAAEYEHRLRQLADKDQRIVFAGNRYGEELAALYSNALAYVTASELEGLPLTLLEAMSNGLPCLASDIPPHREVLQAVCDGFFPVHDVAALATEMEHIMSLSDEERAAMGEACREYVRQNYSWDQAAEQLALAYRRSLAPTV
jgi:glycosyltransferase involved in cell wall biosynthesis